MVTSHERVPVNVKCEPKDKSKLVKEPVVKLARKVKAAHMNNLQAVIYLL